jgi:PAS domain S-box-containing protein
MADIQTEHETRPAQAALRFHHMLEKLPAAAYTCDAQGLITYFNPRAVDLWGRAPRLNDPIDRYCGSFKLFTPDGTPIAHGDCWMALALREDREYNGHEIIVERPDGRRLTALAHANPFRDEFGRLCGAVNVLVDITDRKHMEDALRQADRSKNDFLAMLGHELRNPLAPMAHSLQILQMASADTALAAKAREMMKRQLAHMVRLIDDLLDLSRITRGKVELRRERVDLALVLQDAVDTSRPLIESCGHQFSLVLPRDPVYVNADRMRLAQVFANLLNNAAKYTPQGGRIRLSVERQGTDAVVKVEDNGIGVPTDMRTRIFEMFTQVGQSQNLQGGMGIGLSLVRSLVEMHGGTVEAHSEGAGRGSEFRVRLSATAAPSMGASGGGDGSRKAETSKYRILVVDDNRDSAESLGMMLELMGHEVRTAFDGRRATELAEGFMPQVVLLDIGLPNLNGYEVCRWIRGRSWGQSAVLIAVTGWSQEDDKRRSKEAGFNFHLVKPLEPENLERLLAGLLLAPN